MAKIHNQTEAHIALYKDGKFHKIDQSQGVNFYGSKFLYEKVFLFLTIKEIHGYHLLDLVLIRV